MSFIDEMTAATLQRLPQIKPPTGRAPSSPRSLRAALQGRDQLALIAELKRSSPSQGPLAPGRDAASTARSYALAGASAISVLTEPTRFGGSLEDLSEVRRAVALPVLMKDFILDPRQLEAGRAQGADAALLILRFLSPAQLGELVVAALEIGLELLLESHNESEIDRSLDIDGALIGVNNRDLDRLDVDPRRALRLANRLPAGRVVVAESGYAHREQLTEIRGAYDAVLIGSALMNSNHPRDVIKELLK